MMRSAFLLATTCLFLFSCSKTEDEIVKSTREFSAKIDGKSWSSSQTQASIYNGSITIVGEAIDGSIITISLNGDSVGVYGMDQSSPSTCIYSSGSGKGFTTAGGASGDGQVLIEEINNTENKMSGSFHFTGVRSSDDSVVNVTEGRFVNIPFGNLPIGLEDNNLTVDINGSSWRPFDVSGFTAFKTLFITAIDADGTRTLNFELPYDIGPGKYELNYFTEYKALYISSDGRKHYAVRGTIEIASHNLVNQEIEADFNIYMEEHDGTDIVDLTKGNFKVKYE